MGAYREHYIVSNDEPTQHNTIEELQQENIPKATQANKDPQVKEQTLEVSAATLENQTKSLGETTLGPYTSASPESS